MINLPISSTPQPTSKAANASQADSPNGAGDQEAPPFAKVLADKVDKADKPAASEANAGEETAVDKAEAAQDQAATPVDPLNAILSQIPVEMRGTNVLDRMARLASGDRVTAADGPAILPQANTLAIGVATPSADMGDAPLQADLSVQGAAAQSSSATEAASNSGETLAASEQQLLADALGQRASNRLEAAAAQPAPVQMSAASVSQATLSAMTGLAGNQPTAAVQTVATPLGSTAWGDDFSQKVSWMITQKSQVAELHLNPPNLGPLDVVLKISDNQATALFASPHAAVRDAVENALPKLRELLADNGIMLSNATVGDQSPRDRGAEEFAGRKEGSSAGGSTDNTAEMSATLSAPPVRRHDGMIDTFA